MSFHNILSSLGDRASGMRRLWVEDSFGRLSAAGFAPGDGFVVEPRMGPGLNVRPALLSSTHVSSRAGAAILSCESANLFERFAEPAIRVKISQRLIQVLPSLRAFTVTQPSKETWEMAGQELVTPTGRHLLETGMERVGGRPALLKVKISEENLVAATHFMASLKPGAIQLSYDAASISGQMDLFSHPPVAGGRGAILSEVVSQFLRGCGWQADAGGVFRR